jgi:hypothetical protein
MGKKREIFKFNKHDPTVDKQDWNILNALDRQGVQFYRRYLHEYDTKVPILDIEYRRNRGDFGLFRGAFFFTRESDGKVIILGIETLKGKQEIPSEEKDKRLARSGVLKKIGELDALTTLFVYNQYMEEIPREWGKLSNLQVLKIINDNVSDNDRGYNVDKTIREVHLPEELMNLKNLLYLDIMRPKYLIQTIPDNIYKLRRLKGMSMACTIKSIPESITKLLNLEWLVLNDTSDNWQENYLNLLEYLKYFRNLREVAYISSDLSKYFQNNPDAVTELKLSEVTMCPTLETYFIGGYSNCLVDPLTFIHTGNNFSIPYEWALKFEEYDPWIARDDWEILKALSEQGIYLKRHSIDRFDPTQRNIPLLDLEYRRRLANYGFRSDEAFFITRGSDKKVIFLCIRALDAKWGPASSSEANDRQAAESGVLHKIGELDALTVLIVFNQFMVDIPKEWGKLKNLQVLKIVNKRSFLDDGNYNLDRSIREVSIPEELMELENLLFLDLGRHDYLIQTVPESIYKLKSLKSLVMICSLKFIPQSIAQLPDLERLVFNDTSDNWQENYVNLITYLKSFKNLRELKYISNELRKHFESNPDAVDELHRLVKAYMPPTLESYIIGGFSKNISEL